MTTFYLGGAVLGLLLLCLAYRPYLRIVRWAGDVLLDANPRAALFIHTVLAGTAIGFALVAFVKAQFPQLMSLLLFALATRPSVTVRNPWRSLQRGAGVASALLGMYTVVVTGSVLANCVSASEPGPEDYTNIFRMLEYGLGLERFFNFVGGVFSGYLLGELDLFSSGPEHVFRAWSFAPAGDCPEL